MLPGMKGCIYLFLGLRGYILGFLVSAAVPVFLGGIGAYLATLALSVPEAKIKFLKRLIWGTTLFGVLLGVLQQFDIHDTDKQHDANEKELRSKLDESVRTQGQLQSKLDESARTQESVKGELIGIRGAVIARDKVFADALSPVIQKLDSLQSPKTDVSPPSAARTNRELRYQAEAFFAASRDRARSLREDEDGIRRSSIGSIRNARDSDEREQILRRYGDEQKQLGIRAVTGFMRYRDAALALKPQLVARVAKKPSDDKLIESISFEDFGSFVTIGS